VGARLRDDDRVDSDPLRPVCATLQVPELAEQCEGARQLARELLYQMAYLHKERIPIALLDAHGRDVDLIEICRPLVDAEVDTICSL